MLPLGYQYSNAFVNLMAFVTNLQVCPFVTLYQYTYLQSQTKLTFFWQRQLSYEIFLYQILSNSYFSQQYKYDITQRALERMVLLNMCPIVFNQQTRHMSYAIYSNILFAILCLSLDERDLKQPGSCFNIRRRFQLWDFHCKDETVVRSPYLYNGIPMEGRQHLYIETGPR